MTSNLLGDRYQVGDTLGFGGMSEVHRGRDLRLGRDVAIKVLRADLARDPTFQTRFRREAQNAASLNHPAIVAVYDTGETPGPNGAAGDAASTVPYIVMEFVDGETLRDLLKREGPLPPKRAMEIVADICAALDFSHRHGIVHRDVKPANVMLTRAGAVKVMDFGIARAVADGQATVTATAAVIGTAQYLSPEQARGEAVDARSDVYATGCVLYELLTGAPPFTGDSPVAVAYQHVREDPKPPSSVHPGIPKELDAIVLKALNKNPLNRYQTAAEMRSDLVRALSGQAVHATPIMDDADRTEMLRPPPQRVAARAAQAPLLAPPSILQPTDDWEDDDNGRARKVWGFVGIGVLCLALLGAAIYFTLKITGAPPPPPQVAVPQLQGQTADEAAATLHDKNLTVAQPLVRKASSDADKGKVIDQNPSYGVPVPQGTAVTLTIGEGVQQVSVPNVRGMDAQRAQQEIVDSELKYKEEKVYSATVVKGRVADQKPEPGEQVSPNTPVVVYISQGTQMTSIPDADALIGKDVKDAEAALTAAHLKWVTSSKASDAPKDQVLELGPDHQPGDAVPVDTVVTLVLSDNSLMKMPDLSNQTIDQALARLTDTSVGWTGTKQSLAQSPDPTSDRALWGKVTGQAPKAGDLVSKNTAINVTVGSELQIPMPNLDGMTQQQALDALHAAQWDGQLIAVTENGQVPPPGKGETVIPGSQSPAANTEIPMTDTVTIHLYPKEAPATSSTETSPTTSATASSAVESSSGGGPGNGRGHGGGG
jgi:serine/threonine-protein kinase